MVTKELSQTLDFERQLTMKHKMMLQKGEGRRKSEREREREERKFVKSEASVRIPVEVE
jgi:hypothetical protein